MEFKKCNGCSELKPFSDYSLDKWKKDGRRTLCRKCSSIRSKEFILKNPQKKKMMDKVSYEKRRDKILAQKKIYAKNNKDKIKQKRKVYWQTNKEVISRRNKEYQEKNKEKIRALKKEYYENNKDYFLSKVKEYRQINKKEINAKRNEKIKSSEFLVAKEKIRRTVKDAFNRIKQGKPTKTLNILGADYETVKKHLESKFQEGMTWENHGVYGWHIDHIKPLALAKTVEEVIELNHYTNLQPLWALDNIRKSSKFAEV